VVAEAGGERYYFGDRINSYLVQQSGEYAYPLWGFIAAAALQAGMPEKDMPDVREMFAHVAKTIGTLATHEGAVEQRRRRPEGFERPACQRPDRPRIGARGTDKRPRGALAWRG